MDEVIRAAALYGAGILGALLALATAKLRLDLSLAKHRSLAGHARVARGVAKLLPAYRYDEGKIFRVDGAPDSVAAARQADFHRLATLFRERHKQTLQLTSEVAEGVSDLQFTSAYRVPFQFSPYVRRHLPVGAFVAASSGVLLTDLDGNTSYDLTGSYGVNLFGYDFYKDCIARAVDRVGALGPVLGPYHPIVADNVARLTRISGMDEISFHMSGTEAVMQAVR
ncbi:MAG: aminotransferase class III-fold pyridoxal phosphate-dependent enzyme, partial [Bradyrhizobium sp.]